MTRLECHLDGCHLCIVKPDFIDLQASDALFIPLTIQQQEQVERFEKDGMANLSAANFPANEGPRWKLIFRPIEVMPQDEEHHDEGPSEEELRREAEEQERRDAGMDGGQYL